ncbi:hypothetical protein [Natronoarchaeum rubrum]|uniref:hypothetical protein n=1 Tax=Natronoarchaeum rubrum TaxID=755311 RepID=UPI0021112834|nr:hypothetical protein [Natronoarchaeum rubrum]
MQQTTDRSCPSCGGDLVPSEASDATAECERCVYFERPELDVVLPPCWKEDSEPAARGVDQLFVHLDGPGFIGVDGDTAELVTADLAKGEEPDPVERDATEQNVRDLAQSYNDQFYGENNSAIENTPK